MRRLLHLYILSLLLYLPAGLSAQRLSIQAALDRAEMKTGEQAIVDVTIRTEDVERTKYHLVEHIGEAPRFVVLSFGATDTIDLGGTSKEIRAKMLITSFDSTLISLPPIMAVLEGDTATTEPLALSVVQPEVDLEHPEDIKDIKPLWEVDYLLRDILWLILTSPLLWLAILLAAIGYAAYRYRKYKASRPVFPAHEPKPAAILKTPSEELEEVLRALESRSYHSQEDYKGLYSTLIDALKTYLLQTEGWAWQEMTSSQIRHFLNVTDASPQVKQSIISLLGEADMSKFAKGLPSDADARGAIRTTRAIAEAIEHKLKARLGLSTGANEDKA